MSTTPSDTPPPLTDGDLESMKSGLRDYDTPEQGFVGVKGRYGWSYNGAQEGENLRADLQRVLAEVDRLRAMKCATCGKRIGYLNYKGYLLGWGCADGDECAENAMAAEIDRLRDEVATISRGMDEMDHENQRLRAGNTAMAAKLAAVRGLSGNESMSQGHRFGYESALKDVRAALGETGGTENG